MKQARLLLIAVLALSFAASSAFASDIRIIFDPNTDPPPANITNIFSNDIGVPISVQWQSCSNLGIPSSLSGETACIALNNISNQAISELTIAFTVPAALNGQTVDCENTDNFLTSNNCPAGTLTTGQQVSITFSGGTAVPNDTDMFFGADTGNINVPLSDYPGVSITAAPEPSTLLLLPIGLLILGLGFGWRWRTTA